MSRRPRVSSSTSHTPPKYGPETIPPFPPKFAVSGRLPVTDHRGPRTLPVVTTSGRSVTGRLSPACLRSGTVDWGPDPGTSTATLGLTPFVSLAFVPWLGTPTGPGPSGEIRLRRSRTPHRRKNTTRLLLTRPPPSPPFPSVTGCYHGGVSAPVPRSTPFETVSVVPFETVRRRTFPFRYHHGFEGIPSEGSLNDL